MDRAWVFGDINESPINLGWNFCYIHNRYLKNLNHYELGILLHDAENIFDI